MLVSTSSPEAGGWLRAQRERLRLSARDVEDLSLQIANKKKDKRYYVSHAWLIDIENGRFKPSILKLHTLSRIYQLDWYALLARFQIPIEEAGRDKGHLILPHTHLAEGLSRSVQTVEIPVELRDTAQLELTNLMSRMFEGWKEIPIAFLQQMDLRNSVYGYIGKDDYTLYPIIRPASFVQIDPRQARITNTNWHSDHDRPIYFFELRNKYVCSWCELVGSQLTLIPSPQSRLPARQVRYPSEVHIVGRVTGVTMSIAEMAGAQPRGSSLLRGKLGGQSK
jgi:hypothetical protein